MDKTGELIKEANNFIYKLLECKRIGIVPDKAKLDAYLYQFILKTNGAISTSEKSDLLRVHLEILTRKINYINKINLFF